MNSLTHSILENTLNLSFLVWTMSMLISTYCVFKKSHFFLCFFLLPEVHSLEYPLVRDCCWKLSGYMSDNGLISASFTEHIILLIIIFLALWRYFSSFSGFHCNCCHSFVGILSLVSCSFTLMCPSAWFVIVAIYTGFREFPWICVCLSLILKNLQSLFLSILTFLYSLCCFVQFWPDISWTF